MTSDRNKQLLSKAQKLYESGQLVDAEAILSRLLAKGFEVSDVYEYLGYVKGSQGELDAAIRNLKRACTTPGCSPTALYYLGTALRMKENFEEAIVSYQRCLELFGPTPEALNDLGVCFSQLGRYSEAYEFYNAALRLSPTSPEIYFNLGCLLEEQNFLTEALESYENALDHRRNYSAAWNHRGSVLAKLCRNPEALKSFEFALRASPDNFYAYNNKAVALTKAGSYKEALKDFDTAISLKKDYADAYINKATLFVAMNRYADAIACYEQALNYAPKANFVFGNYFHLKMKICDWAAYSKNLKKLTDGIRNNDALTNPFPVVGLVDDPNLQQRTAVTYVQTIVKNIKSDPFCREPKHSTKIKIGYFSSDFHNHATAYLISELFELHDRSLFAIYGLSLHQTQCDEMTKRISAGLDYFVDLSGASDEEVIRISRGLELDIAIDLKGFTNNARPTIFAARVAPLQVAFLGYPGTMGATFIDYIIADKVVLPEKNRKHFTEQIAYLPNSYQVNDSKRKKSEREFSRSELGLPDTGFVFCCFNNSFKINPDVLDLWSKILKSVEGSVLWLYESNDLATRNLRNEIASRGLDPTRLVFGKHLPNDQHLSRLGLADLFLDTWPCGAHTTASDSLWSGVPVLTMPGESFASRVSTSLLIAMGLTELVAQSPSDYFAKAVAFAKNRRYLSQIKSLLAHKKITSTLFDTKLFCRHLEQAYIEMHHLSVSGSSLKQIDVSDITASS